MKVIKKELKDAVATVKRFLKDKVQAKVLVQIEENEVKIQAFTQQLIVFYILKNVEPKEELAFFVNPYELEGLLKGKEKELAFEIEGETMRNEHGSIPIQHTEKKKMSAIKNVVPFENEQLFLDILKEADTLLHASEHGCTSYLNVSSKRAMAAEPKRIHYYRLEENFQFDNGHIHKDIVGVLTRSLKGNLKHGQIKNAMIIAENDKTFYFINIDKKTNFPQLNKIKTQNMVTSFEVDAKQFNEIAKSYKVKVKMIEFKEQNNKLVFDPRDEEFEIGELDIFNQTAPIKPALFDAQTIKGLFNGYDDKVKIEHYEFTNTYGQPGYMWRIVTTNKITMAAGIEEPNWDEIKINHN